MKQATMPDIEEFYILGMPIQTEIGKINFLKVKDYPLYFADLQLIGKSKLELISNYKEINKDGSLDEFLEELEELELFDIAMGVPELQQAYLNVFLKVLDDEDAINYLEASNFDYYRELIMRMNAVHEEEINPNPEIQKALERSKRVKAMGQDKLTFSDMCSSIVAHTGNMYSDLQEFTIYQFYMTFQRIGLFKNYDTSTLFATVSEKAEIENWSKRINLYEKESHVMSEDKFSSSVGSVINE